MYKQKRRRAFTLIEMLVATIIFSIALTTILSVFEYQKRGYVEEVEIHKLNQNVRAAMDIFCFDLRMAGAKSNVSYTIYNIYIASENSSSTTALSVGQAGLKFTPDYSGSSKDLVSIAYVVGNPNTTAVNTLSSAMTANNACLNLTTAMQDPFTNPNNGTSTTLVYPVDAPTSAIYPALIIDNYGTPGTNPHFGNACMFFITQYATTTKIWHKPLQSPGTETGTGNGTGHNSFDAAYPIGSTLLKLDDYRYVEYKIDANNNLVMRAGYQSQPGTGTGWSTVAPNIESFYLEFALDTNGDGVLDPGGGSVTWTRSITGSEKYVRAVRVTITGFGTIKHKFTDANPFLGNLNDGKRRITLTTYQQIRNLWYQ